MSNFFFITGQIIHFVTVGGLQKDLNFESNSGFSIFVTKT